ncbi:Crp/Fnr family transcriptional regulator [Maritimibacter alkaliphilus]|uniref:Crp/Fnr family transcriptional regulator n=1 Tax=Maritimibacter alkaliphilus TaxID=404236 RepID=UPI001C980923|nr:Crp/Fnr family transcriptional regulator [Maritimibacter alkaliphilus]MBY6089331.1 Crp/Fnr family transcriptional regulator [Maritimibacter alkaliphilus]
MRSLKVLRTQGWLASTGPEFRDAVLGRADLIRFGNGETVYNAGDPSGAIYGILDGHLEVHLQGVDASNSLAFISGPGAWHGDLASTLGRRRLLTLTARGPCQLLRLRREELQRICAEQPCGWQEIARLLATNMALTFEVVGLLRIQNLSERVARALLLLAQPETGAPRVVRASQSDIATIIQASRSAVAARLAEFEAQGHVKRGYGTIVLAAPEALEAVVGLEREDDLA